MMNEYTKYIDIVKAYIYKDYQLMFREPEGIMKHKFIVPGSDYTDSLWDWDSWLTDVALRQILSDRNEENNILEYEKGCILNFLNHTDTEGYMPILITPNCINIFGISGFESNMHKPCIAQHIAFLLKNGADCEWIRPYFDKLKTFINAYRNHYKHSCGLYYWASDFAIGVDNEPCTFYRPKCSTASVYLNILMYKELEAMAYIAKELDMDKEYLYYSKEQEHLSKAIQDNLWDEKDGFFYSADLNLLPINQNEILHSGAPRHWDCLIMRLGVWTGMLAMWAGIATKEQAERMVKENYLDKRTFNAAYGIRSLSKMEKMYYVGVSSNPSCWLGPVWGISNYFTFRGLLEYGYEKEARELALKTIELFGKDIEQCGEMHEYYDPDTGHGVHNQGFQSWNFLVLNMIAYLENRNVIKEF